jgi:NAD(P)H-hydrate epimerase
MATPENPARRPGPTPQPPLWPGYRVPPVTDAATVRRWDRATIEEFGIPGLILMENAGEGCVRRVEELAPRHGLVPPFCIVCGPGNNGGDGFVIARHLHNRGAEVEVLLATPAAGFAADSDAGINLEIVRRMGVPVRETADDTAASRDAALAAAGTAVDACFGTGLARAVEEPILGWIHALNRCGRPVVSVDVPSGLDADRGLALGAAVRATVTLTFVAPKRGFALEEGPACAGEVHVIGISIPRELLGG